MAPNQMPSKKALPKAAKFKECEILYNSCEHFDEWFIIDIGVQFAAFATGLHQR